MKKVRMQHLIMFMLQQFYWTCERVMAFFTYISLEFVDATPSTL